MNSYSRGSHALYLELRQCPALPVRLRSRESNHRHALSLSVTTPRRWPFPFGPTVLGGFRITRRQKSTQKKSVGVGRDSNPGRLISSPTLYVLCHRAPLDCHSEFSESYIRFVISDPKNPYIRFFSQEIEVFPKFCLLHWIANLNFLNPTADSCRVNLKTRIYLFFSIIKLDFFHNFIGYSRSTSSKIANLIEDS